MKLRKHGNVTGVNFKIRRPFPEIERPRFTDRLRFPDDLTKLTPANISELHGKYTQLYTYANQELCSVNQRILQVQTKDSLRRHDLFRRSPSINAQEKWRRDAVFDSDPEVLAMSVEMSKLRQVRAYHEMMRDNFEKYIAALSRELSRRTNDHNRVYNG